MEQASRPSVTSTSTSHPFVPGGFSHQGHQSAGGDLQVLHPQIFFGSDKNEFPLVNISGFFKSGGKAYNCVSGCVSCLVSISDFT